MNPYTPEELERIEKLRSANESFESHFIKQREDWNNAINPLFEDIRNSFNVEKTEKVIEIQSLALSYRQKINDQISKNLSTITVRSKDGFQFNLDVSQIIHIPATEAPKVIW